jgi:hypothetical protein
VIVRPETPATARGTNSEKRVLLDKADTDAPDRVAGQRFHGPSQRLSAYFPPRLSFHWLLLTVGQVLSVIFCILIPLGAVVQLGLLERLRQSIGETAPLGDPRAAQVETAVLFQQAVVVVTGVLLFCWNAALYVVFSRAKVLAQIASDQDAENQQLWRAIEALQTARAG